MKITSDGKLRWGVRQMAAVGHQKPNGIDGMKVRASDISGVLKAVFEFGGFCGATKF